MVKRDLTKASGRATPQEIHHSMARPRRGHRR